LTGHVSQQIGAFATPNWENVRKLMRGAGFDPRPHWTWAQLGGQGVGTVTLDPDHGFQPDQRVAPGQACNRAQSR
jgi:hypothetical protein